MQVFFYCSCFEWRLVHRLQIHRSVEGSSEVLNIITFLIQSEEYRNEKIEP